MPPNARHVQDNVPDIELLNYLHEILDGLLLILSDKSDDIRRMAANQLAEFLREIRATGLNCASVLPTLVRHSAAADDLTACTALGWLHDFLRLAGPDMLPFQADLLRAFLPAQAARPIARAANQELMRLYMRGDGVGDGDAHQEAVNVVVHHVDARETETRTASMRWLLLYWQKQPALVYAMRVTLVPRLIAALADKHEEVALLAVEAIAEFCAYPNPDPDPDPNPNPAMSPPAPAALTPDVRKYLRGQGPDDGAGAGNDKEGDADMPGMYRDILGRVLESFAADAQLLDRRGALIICQLCALLSPERLFVELATTLAAHEDADFVGHMVQALATILLTTAECRPLRARLKDLTKPVCAIPIPIPIRHGGNARPCGEPRVSDGSDAAAPPCRPTARCLCGCTWRGRTTRRRRCRCACLRRRMSTRTTCSGRLRRSRRRWHCCWTWTAWSASSSRQSSRTCACSSSISPSTRSSPSASTAC
jgi:vacuole morphology and inheritance protein 14